MEKIRLQKYMSQVWVCSRRKSEEYIEAWLVEVDGEIAHIGQSIDPNTQKVTLKTQAIKEQNNLVYYKLNKPRGIVTTCAAHDQRSILEIVDIQERVFPVGRLDKETNGLILLTNDWRLANHLMHPRYNHKKQYHVEVFWPIDDRQLQELENWVFILWSMTKKAEIQRLSSWRFSITITEWRNRQIRRMVEKVWGQVKKLTRVRIENIELWNLQEWEYKKLSKAEVHDLLWLLNLSSTQTKNIWK